MVALMLFTYILWGASAVATKAALAAVPPFLLAAIRVGMGLAFLFLWMRARAELLRPASQELLLLLINGLLAYLVMGLFNLSLKYTTASRATIFIHTTPFYVAILAHFLLPGDRLNWQRMVGLTLAFAGLTAIFQGKDQGAATLMGDILVLLSALLLGGQHILQKKLVMNIPPAKLLFWSTSTSFSLFTMSWLFWEPRPTGMFSSSVIFSILYLGLAISGFCFLVQITLLKRYSPNILASFSFVAPVFGVAASILLLKEALTPGLALGTPLVAAGIFMVYRWTQVETPQAKR